MAELSDRTLLVTTSWDDGHVLDLRLADMLRAHGISGTFYVCPGSTELGRAERLTSSQIVDLARDFEIGGHTLTHRLLSTLEDDEAAAEIRDGRDALEQILGVRLRSFCYPGGRYSQRDVNLVKEAGFDVARTIRRYASSFPSDLLQLRTTVHAYRHFHDVPRMARSCGPRPARLVRWCAHWDELAIGLFDRALARGGVFHLWGHSWEIDKLDDWDRLERVFRHIASTDGVEHVRNGQLADLRPLMKRAV